MKILIAYFEFPEYDRKSGSLRMFEILRILVQAEHKVTFLSSTDNDERYRRAIEDLGIQCVSDGNRALRQSADSMQSFLESGNFDLAILVSYDIYNRYAPFIRASLPQCRLVFDTTDLAYIRHERQAEVEGTAESKNRAANTRREETAAIRNADSVWTVSRVEKEIIQSSLPGKSVHVVTNIHAVADAIPEFNDRKDVVFIGSYGHAPNIDGIELFMEQIFPIIRRSLPGVRFTIAGERPPDAFHRYQEEFPEVSVTGYVEDHRALLMKHRVAVAPLRFGAGVKGKIGEYFCCGLPCVSTTIGVEGMGLQNEESVLVADDPLDFANAVIRLYNDELLWQRLAESGIAYIERNMSANAVKQHLLTAIDAAATMPASQHKVSSRSLLKYLSSPAHFGRWATKGYSTLLSRGPREFIKQFLIWLRKPI